MRTFFIMVAFLGFLLIGLGVYQFRGANEENTKLAAFGEAQYESISGQKAPPKYKLIWASDHIAKLEIISMGIVAAGAVLAGIGLFGANNAPKYLMAPTPSEKT